MQILPFLPTHIAASEDLSATCFGPARHLRTAALLRRGAPLVAAASFVAVEGDVLIGSVQCHRIEWCRADGLRRDLILLGPLVSHPGHRNRGVGSALMNHATAAIDRLGMATTLIGDAPYYQRWNFSAAATARWTLPGPVDRNRLLLRATDAASWNAPAVVGCHAGGAARAA